MTQDPSKISEGIADVRLTICDLAGLDESELTDDEALFSAGLIDSLSLIRLITYVEETFAFKVSPSEINLGNWDSVDAIKDYIARRLET